MHYNRVSEEAGKRAIYKNSAVIGGDDGCNMGSLYLHGGALFAIHIYPNDDPNPFSEHGETDWGIYMVPV